MERNSDEKMSAKAKFQNIEGALKKDILNDDSDQIVISTKQIKTIDTHSKNRKKLENLKLKIDAKNDAVSDEVNVTQEYINLANDIKVIDDDIYEIDDTVIVNPEDININQEEILNNTIEDLDEIINVDIDLDKMKKVQQQEERTDKQQDDYIDKTFDDLYDEIESSTSEYDVDDIDLSILDNISEDTLSDEEIDKILDEE